MSWLIAGLIMCFGLGALLGAPFLPVRRQDAATALDLADLKAGETFIDLGSGDGRMLAAAARRGAMAIGYEVNPLLVFYSYVRTWRYRRQVTIRPYSYWHGRLPRADVIYSFLLDRYMDRLDRKLMADIRQPTRVVSYVFELPRKPTRKTRNTFLYLYHPRAE